jgi:asparagine synthase (glutamine-hydrolysing)
MCGIAAVIGGAVPPAQTLEAALATLAHRGPDDSGVFRRERVWLGSRRLAIQDLSAAGHMPMTAEGIATIVFNGEIYNYLELRDELIAHGHRFASDSDTEVLLRAYLEWGVDCLPRLNGMWAFVIWDERDGSSFIARDRVGVKPLYFTRAPGCTIVASEPKFILAVYPATRAVNERALFQLLAEKRVDVSHQSFYRAIEVFPAGSYAVVRTGDGEIDAQTFWRYPDAHEPAPPMKLHELEDEFARLLEDSVRLRLRSDVPVGLTLSGGLDSTAILSATQRVEPDREEFAFTSVYGGSGTYDERSWARTAVEPYSRVALEEVDTPMEAWQETLAKIVWHMDGPGLSPAVFPLWRIMEKARAERIPVVLEGQGADELLGGYAVHRMHALLDRASQLRRHPRLDDARLWLKMLRSAVDANGARRTTIDAGTVSSPTLRRLRDRYVGVRGALAPEFLARSEGDLGGQRERPQARNSRDRLAAKLERDFSRDLLPAFLQYGDAISMAHSIESRLPFLDYRMVEFCVRLPASLRGGGTRSKEILRTYLRGAGQPAIAARADKKGFPTPAGAWLGANDGQIPRELLLGVGAQIAPYIDRRAVARLIERQVAGHYAASDQLYALTTAEIWLRTCVRTAA